MAELGCDLGRVRLLSEEQRGEAMTQVVWAKAPSPTASAVVLKCRLRQFR
jgi:hypothetical protein